MTTGENIKAARKRAGMTQKELGDALGVSFQTVAQWETSRRNPKRETLKRIADALGVAWYDLDANIDIIEEIDTSKSIHAPTPREDVGTAGRRKLVAVYENLSEAGQAELLKRAKELEFLPQYRRCDETEEVDSSTQGKTDNLPE